VEDPAGDVLDLLFVEADATPDGWFRVAEDRFLERVAEPTAEREAELATLSHVVGESRKSQVNPSEPLRISERSSSRKPVDRAV
jgi:hypothetical protein